MEDPRLSEIARTMNIPITQAFGSPDAAELGNVLICIDESQNFCPHSLHVYPDTPHCSDAMLNQSEEKRRWNQCIREIIRSGSRIYLLANTSSFELLKNEPTVESSFDNKIFYAKYFSTSEILDALELIEGKGRSYVPFSQTTIIEILEFIISESNGYPGICGYIFSVLNDLVKQVRSTAYSTVRSDIARIWREKRWQLLLKYLEISRLVTRIQLENINDLNAILNSRIVILENQIPCDISLSWVRVGLRCGVLKVVGENITLSCNTMRNILLKCTKRRLLDESDCIYSLINKKGL